MQNEDKTIMMPFSSANHTPQEKLPTSSNGIKITLIGPFCH